MEVRGSGEARELSAIMLSCIVQAATIPVITWLKRSEGEVTVLLNTTRTSITSHHDPTEFMTTNILTINRTVPTDSGEYVCEADTAEVTSTPVVIQMVVVLGNVPTQALPFKETIMSAIAIIRSTTVANILQWSLTPSQWSLLLWLFLTGYRKVT